MFVHSSSESLTQAVLQVSLSWGTVAFACQHSALIPFVIGSEEVSVHGQVPLEGEAGLCLRL